jgi:pimeloyl-ACP methyl ester carboxylesterase
MIEPAARVAQLAALSESVRVSAGGTELAWRRWPGPSGHPPLLLLHGGFGSWTHWIANLPGLMAERETWTLDLPGLGDSGDLSPPFTTEHFADVVASGLVELFGDSTPYALAGFSFGAMIGAHVSLRTGKRCQRLSLVGAAGCGHLHHQVSLLPPPDHSLPADEAAAIHRDNLQRLMIADPAAIDDLAVHVHGDNLDRHRFRSRKLAGSDDLLRVLPDIPAPLVGIWGERDATAGDLSAIEERGKLFSAAQPDAEFHILKGIGHWAMYEAPDQVNRLLLGGSAHQA